MATVSIYLNFNGNTEEAFNYYKDVFQTEFIDLQRMGQVPPQPDMPELSEAEKNMVMHVAMPLLGGVELMGTDSLESMGQKVEFGNNISINLQPDTRAETDRLFAGLSEGGKVDMELQDMFWGDYFGACVDKFGVQWMFVCSEPPATS